MGAQDYLGSGWAYPLRFSPATGGAEMVQGQASGEASIHNILSTKIGEYPFNPEFGSRLHNLVFEHNSKIFASMARLYIEEAIYRWEPRIQSVEVSFPDLENELGSSDTVHILITYRTITEQVARNMVYPFTVQSA